jgi:hypothetical protein
VLRRASKAGRPALAALAVLALGLAAPALAAAPTPAPGPWSGHAAVYKLSFKVAPDGGEIESLHTTWTPLPACGVPISGEEHTAFPDLAVKGGGFRGQATGIEDGRISVEGRFTGSGEVTGRFSARLSIPGFPTCVDSGAFEAEHR